MDWKHAFVQPYLTFNFRKHSVRKLSSHPPSPIRHTTNATAGRHASTVVSVSNVVSDIFPSCVPKQAARIEDPYARSMLKRIKYTQIETDLSTKYISTAHGISTSTTDPDAVVLFLHGFDSNMLEYRYMLPIFDELQNVEAHFVDILGWGLTERPFDDDFSYGPVSKRQHLLAYHQQFIGKRPIVLVGASIGSAVAVDYALAFPQLVQSLVLLAPQVFIDKKANPIMQTFPVFASIGADILRSDWLRSIAVQLSYEDPKLKCEDTLRIGGLHCYSEGWKDATIDFVLGDGYCLSNRVQDVTSPTLVLWGDNDRVLPKKDRDRFPDAIPGSKLVIVENCGHSPHIEKPQFVSSQIVQFLGT